MPDSCLLHFALTELYEERKRIAEARSVYESFLDRLHAQIASMEESLKKEIEQLEAEHANTIQGSKSPNRLGEDDGEERERIRALERECAKAKEKATENWQKKISTVRRTCTLIWIMLMRFVRRAEVRLYEIV
jgi:septal ring factor EnvC (AmiA/AmiB activator)